MDRASVGRIPCDALSAVDFERSQDLHPRRLHRPAVEGFQASGFRFGFRVSGFGIRDSSFKIRVSDSGFGFRVSGFGFRVSGLGFRVYVGPATGARQPAGPQREELVQG